MAEKRVYTDEELIRRVWDLEDIRDLTARRVYYVANDMRREELDELWVREPENCASASFGRNWGYYVGMDSIRRFYVREHEARRQRMLDALCARHPEIENCPENLGLGTMELNPVTTPQIELAGDGKTARGIWFSTGMITELEADMAPRANWAFEKMGIDYIKEGTDWKIWHLFSSLELFYESGTDCAKLPLEPALPLSPYEEEFSRPDISFLTHNVRYNWWDEYPPEPEPYDTYTPERSYSPEGHPAMQSEKSMRLWERGLLKW